LTITAPAGTCAVSNLGERGRVERHTEDEHDGDGAALRLRAVHRNQKLKDAMAQLLELGMAVAPDRPDEPARAPKPVRLKGRGLLDIREIDAPKRGFSTRFATTRAFGGFSRSCGSSKPSQPVCSGD
jgi:hypothetical protein